MADIHGGQRVRDEVELEHGIGQARDPAAPGDPRRPRVHAQLLHRERRVPGRAGHARADGRGPPDLDLAEEPPRLVERYPAGVEVEGERVGAAEGEVPVRGQLRAGRLEPDLLQHQAVGGKDPLAVEIQDIDPGACHAEGEVAGREALETLVAREDRELDRPVEVTELVRLPVEDRPASLGELDVHQAVLDLDRADPEPGAPAGWARGARLAREDLLEVPALVGAADQPDLGPDELHAVDRDPLVEERREPVAGAHRPRPQERNPILVFDDEILDRDAGEDAAPDAAHADGAMDGVPEPGLDLPAHELPAPSRLQPQHAADDRQRPERHQERHHEQHLAQDPHPTPYPLPAARGPLASPAQKKVARNGPDARRPTTTE